MNKEMQGMNWKVGPGNKQNQDKWNLIVKKMSGDKWKGQMGSDKDLKQQIDSLWNSWKKWQTDNGITPSAAGMFGDTKLEKDDAWIPERAYRIDVTTNFDENWYKRKFKSGMLNKLIVGLKNQAMSFTPDDIKQKYGDKKYSVDDMTDADKSKLDGIKWKMTNKITTAYITYLLGWKRWKRWRGWKWKWFTWLWIHRLGPLGEIWWKWWWIRIWRRIKWTGSSWWGKWFWT